MTLFRRRRDDDERFDGLYREHYAAVMRFARRRADAATAEDAVAETFTIAWRRLDQVPAHALPWLLTTAAYELSTRRRAAASDADKVRSAQANTAVTARDPADVVVEGDAVRRALGALSEPDQEALRLVAWDGLSLADGARVAGTTRLAFAMRVSRARRRLAAHLEARPEPSLRNPSSHMEASL